MISNNSALVLTVRRKLHQHSKSFVFENRISPNNFQLLVRASGFAPGAWNTGGALQRSEGLCRDHLTAWRFPHIADNGPWNYRLTVAGSQ